jgi:alkanesulfonate monooxygenase SsuD/methylene tetrahydromethanopterin reductase-like flavin-dependent oxidoreductase (luciferase family)
LKPLNRIQLKTLTFKKECLMKFGVVMRTDIPLSNIADLAQEAEASGWNGFFLWDSFAGQDPWILLTSVALRTQHIRFGPLVTAPSRRRPWQLASETATLDHLSEGRVILPVGLGAAEDLGFARFGEVMDRKIRAELLDESIDILQGLWSEKPFSYNGKHYHLQEAVFQLTPTQTPRIPIWVVAAWPRQKSMRRALRCDGILPVKATAEGISNSLMPEDLRAIKTYADKYREQTTPFDIVLEGETPGEDPARASAMVRPFADAGVTWWLEDVAATPYKTSGLEGMRLRIKQGPPPME